MRLSADHATVPHGTVSFLATNGGSINHEMVILPLPASRVVGARPTGADAKISEAGSLGEASNTNGKGAGQGVAPRASSWITVNLTPGQYELVCTLPNHYTAGMYPQLPVPWTPPLTPAPGPLGAMPSVGLLIWPASGGSHDKHPSGWH